MARRISYAHLENGVRSHFRNNLNQAESSEEVKKFFAYAVHDLLNKAFEGHILTDYGQVELGSDLNRPYLIHQRLMHDLTFTNAWFNTDLATIIDRLAATAIRHMKHFDKMPERTDRKIFPTPSHGGHSFRNPPQKGKR
jgi:hypothetical protein